MKAWCGGSADPGPTCHRSVGRHASPLRAALLGPQASQSLFFDGHGMVQEPYCGV